MKSREHGNPLLLIAVFLALPWQLVACTAPNGRFPWEAKAGEKKTQSWARDKQAPFEAPFQKPLKTRYSSVPGKGPVIAMTFDDGPRPWTMDLLDMLKERHLRATFFVVGQAVKQYPEVIKRIAAEGHELANHTWSHPNLARRPKSFVQRELQMTQDILVKLTGFTPRVMRPPGGALSKDQSQWIYDEFGYATILWSVDPEDWKRPGLEAITDRILNGYERSEGVHDGAILLAHDLHQPTVKAMPETLDQLMARGYQFLTVSELLALDQPDAELLLIQAEELDEAMASPGVDGPALPRLRARSVRLNAPSNIDG